MEGTSKPGRPHLQLLHGGGGLVGGAQAPDLLLSAGYQLVGELLQGLQASLVLEVCSRSSPVSRALCCSLTEPAQAAPEYSTFAPTPALCVEVSSCASAAPAGQSACEETGISRSRAPLLLPVLTAQSRPGSRASCTAAARAAAAGSAEYACRQQAAGAVL